MAGLRDDILQQLQLRGRQSARQLAAALGRNEKLVMRHLADLADDGAVVFDAVPEMRLLRLRYFCVRRSVVRYYRLPIRTQRGDPWRERWVR